MATIHVFRQHVEALVEDDPTIRVFRQHVEALVEDAPIIRVFRQFIEVLIPDKTGDGTSTISMGSTATASMEFNRSAENTLAITDDGHNTEVSISASSSLGMGQSVGLVRSFSVSAGNTLELSDGPESRGPISRSAFSSLILDSSVRIPLEIPVEASSTLSMSQAAYSAGSIDVSASNALELQVFADEVNKLRQASNELSLGQSVAVDKAVPAQSQLELSQTAHVDSVSKTASTEISMTQFARAEPVAQSTISTLDLTQTVRSNFHQGVASSTIEFVQSTIVSKPIRVSAESELTVTEETFDFNTLEFVTTETGLRHSVDVAGDLSRSQHSQLGVRQSVSVFKVLATAIPGDATSAISLGQSVWASLTLGPEAESIIVFAQASTGDIGYSLDGDLSLSQTATYSIVRAARTSSSEIGVTQSATYILETGSSRHQYSPFVGASTDPNAPDPPSAAIDGPMVGIEVPFQLVYPSIGAVTDSVALKTPNLGNKDRLAFNRVLRETRG